MTTNAPEHDRTFTTSTGRTFTVRYIPQGSPLFSTTHRITPAPTPAVEFYDASALGTPAALGHPAGQFTGARYRADTLLGLDHTTTTGALALGGLAAWTIDADTMTTIRAWIAEHGTPNPAKARILAGHPVHRDPRAQRHNEHYGPAEAFRPYHTPDGLHGGWYARHGTADCGHEYTNIDRHGLAGISTGYAIDPDTDLSHCHPCAAEQTGTALDALTDSTDRVTAYISDDGRTLTTWPGIELAHVINHQPGRHTHHWTFQRGDRTYHGTNQGPGMAIDVHAHHARAPLSA